VPPLIQDLLDKIGGPRRAGIIGVGLLAAAFIFAISRWATAPEWVPAYTNLPLETSGKMTDELDRAGVQYRLERGGADLMVPASELSRVRVVLAQQGLPAKGRPGLELFDQPSWGMTDFTQRINYRRALEGELERTIAQMRGVEAAQVHLALHETSSFRRPNDKPAAASVVLKLSSGQQPQPEIVQGIAQLVAASVDGVESENVSVLDDAGHLLSDPYGPNSVGGLSNQQLKVQREVEEYMERKATGLLAQMVGPGNATVQVSAAMSFDKVERTTQLVDPEKQALSTEQRSEITPGAQGGAASSNTATSYENSRSTEVFSGSVGNIRRLSVAVLVNEKQAAPGAKEKPAPRTAAEIAGIETLIRSAVGFDSTRGDVVSVVSVPFGGAAPAQVDGGSRLWETVQTVQRPGLTVLGLLLAFAIAFVAIRSLRTAPVATMAATEALPAPAELPPLEAPASAALPAPEPITFASNPIRDRVATAVESHPDVAARLVRSWLKEG